MGKMLLLILILIVISIAACQQNQDVVEKKSDAMEKTVGDAAVDAVGNDLNNVNTVEKDLSADGLSDLDSGFEDVQNI